MKTHERLANSLRDTLVYDAYSTIRGIRTIRRWITQGRPAPPPHAIKRQAVSAYGRKYNLRTLIETGTFRGDMVYAMRRSFDRIISIELDVCLYNRASQRLAKLRNVELLCGDSAELLASVLDSIRVQSLFWLDGHYSGPGTACGHQASPILAEVSMILSHSVKSHIILIDDAREFLGREGYPTITRLKEIAQNLNAMVSITVADDIIRIVPACLQN
jgi:hypothetical protein